jgi:hypothetical protein
VRNVQCGRADVSIATTLLHRSKIQRTIRPA